MTTIFEAINLAADNFERHPGLFDFMNNRVPACGTPGCLLGWVGHFMGVPAGTEIREVAILLGGDWGSQSVDQILHADESGYTQRAQAAVRLLRKSATYFKPAPLPFVDIPKAVREIFDAPITGEIA